MPLIGGIHRPAIRARKYMDEENNSQYGSDRNYVSNIDTHKKTIPLMKRITLIRMELLKIGNGNLSQMIQKLLIHQIIMMGPIF